MVTAPPASLTFQIRHTKKPPRLDRDGYRTMTEVVAGTRFKAANRPITYKAVELTNEFSGRTVLAVSLYWLDA